MSLREQLQQTLGDAYVIEQELGGGGMSRVFVATDRALDRRVVIKVLPTEMAGQLSTDRFKREISIAARLQHPHVVPLLSAGMVDGLPYFTMPYVEGESLRALLARQGELPLTDAVRMLREVASALSYAHSREVVHRDIKPDNVLLSGGSAMVTDFGVAKALNAAGEGSSGGITSIGMTLGTPAYMAPEQAAADPHVDHRADIYSWGMLAYELLTGRSPFAGRTPQAMLAAQVTEAPEPIVKRRAGLSASLSNLVMRCLEKRPADRPQSAEELVHALDAIVTPSSGGAQAAVPPTLGARSGIGLRRALLGGGLLALIAAAAWLMKSRGNHAEDVPTELSLAVLPIENLGGDSTTEYLADGMTGELSGALKRIPGLQVAGDISTFRFKGKHADPSEIGRELKVKMLLTGKLQPGKGRVRLQMQLNASDGKLLWSNTYNKDNKDSFAMQDEITAAIASELRLVLTPATLAVTQAGRTTNAEAHDLYLKGWSEKNKVSESSLRRAATYFQEALKLDPNYAQAHAGLAFAYDMLADVYAPSHEYHMLALAAARKAVAADSLLAEARVMYGYELATATWDIPTGRAEMERALALNPKSQDVLFTFGMFFWVTGNTERALEFADRLAQVDPLSPLAARLKAEAYQWAGRNEEALAQDKIANKLDPGVLLVESTEGNALRELGRYDESVASFLAFKRTFDQPSWGLAVTYARMGKRDEAMQEVRALEAREKQQWVEPNFIAFCYAALGDRDKAFEWMDKAFRAKDWTLRALMNWDPPWYASLRDDPRFIALRQKVLATTFKN